MSCGCIHVAGLDCEACAELGADWVDIWKSLPEKCRKDPLSCVDLPNLPPGWEEVLEPWKPIKRRLELYGVLALVGVVLLVDHRRRC